MGSQFTVKVTLTSEASLVQARGTQARLFGTTDAALKLLHKLGVRRIVLEGLKVAAGSGPEHKRSRPTRPGTHPRRQTTAGCAPKCRPAATAHSPPSQQTNGKASVLKTGPTKSIAGPAAAMTCAAYRVDRRP